MRRRVRFLVRSVVYLLVLCALAVGALAWRLSQGPISAKFLVPTLEQTLSSSSSGFKVEIADAAVTWAGWREGLLIEAHGIRTVRRDGAQMATIPSIAVHLSIRALMVGEIAPRQLTIVKPRLSLVRNAQGNISFGVRTRGAGPNTVVTGLVDALSGERQGEGPLRRLIRVQISDGELTIEDAFLNRSWEAPRVNMLMERDQRGVRVNADLSLKIENREVNFNTQGLYNRRSGDISGELRFMNLEPALFVSATGRLRALDALKVPLSGTIAVAMRDTGEISSIQFNVAGQTGTLSLPSIYREDLDVIGFASKGRFTNGLRNLQLDEFRLRFPGPEVNVVGKLTDIGPKLAFNGKLSMRHFPVRDLGNYWPSNIKINARRWVAENIHDGMVNEFDVGLDLRLEPDDPKGVVFETVQGEFKFSDLTVRYQRQLPPAKKLSGTARFDKQSLKFTVLGGSVESVRLKRAQVDIVGFGRGYAEDMIIGADIEGKLSDILTILDREPFRYARQLGVNPLAVVGNVQTRLGIRFRLDEIINFEDVALTANAEIADLDWKKGVFGLDVSRGAFKLSLDNKGMELAGNAQLSDSPAVISWRENFGDKVGFRRQLKISTPVTATTLKNLGLEISSFITGQLAAVVNVTGYDNGVNNIDGVFDLRDAAFTTPLLQLTKRPGQPGQATATIQLRNHRVAAISKLSVDTGELKVTGSLTFHPDGQTMKDIEITRLVAGRTDISAKLVGDRTGAKRGTISGTSLDLVPILAKRSDSGDFLLTPIDIAGSIGTLHFSRDRSVTNFQGDAQFDGKSWRRIRLDALAEGKKVQIALIPDAQGRALTVRADDAGAAFRSLNVIDTIRGGRITISARGVDGPQGATFRGRAEMLNFRIVRAPVMARIMALASFSGIGNLLATDQGVEFQEFSAPFSMANGIISVTNARAIGSQIGITASGSLDFPKDRADLRGTVVPAYTLNSIVGKIPLIGDVLVGERNSGLLAATYSVRGPLSNPELNVNPLTMLTPGFLRNITEIFEGRSGEVENPPAPQFDPNGPSRETR